MGPIIQLAPSSARMRVVILLSLLAGAIAAPESRLFGPTIPTFLCSECVDEMHKLGHMVKMGAVVIHDYIRDNYCPTLGDHRHFCRESLSRYYVGMLYAVVEHYFVDGALHVCQTGGVCEAAKEYTCDEDHVAVWARVCSIFPFVHAVRNKTTTTPTTKKTNDSSHHMLENSSVFP